MKNTFAFRSRLLPLFVLAGLSAATPLAAQTFSGADNFNDNTLTVGVGERWRFDAVLSGSGTAFTEQNQRMEFMSNNETGFNGRVLGWISPSVNGGAYGVDWSASVSVTNLTSPTSGFTYAGLETYTAFDTGAGLSNSGYYGVYLSTNAAGDNLLVTEWGRWDASLNGGEGDWVRTTNGVGINDMTDVVLRFNWTAATESLTADYSVDAGESFITGQTFALNGTEAGLGAPYADGFGLELTGLSGNAGVVTAGQITFDDMNVSVSAIPEPSTYAALAGIATLGLALWRRRQRTA